MSSEKKAEKKPKEGRYLGWQASPIQQAAFGGTTKSGANNQSFVLKHSTGPEQAVTKKWFILDASQVPVGRLATTAASILMGKHKASFTPGADSGDGVIVVNTDKAFFSSNKADKKFYYWHTGWMGGIKVRSARDALLKNSEKVVWDAVYGMMPKTNLSRYQLKHLKTFKDDKHSMSAQKPTVLELGLKKALKAVV